MNRKQNILTIILLVFSAYACKSTKSLADTRVLPERNTKELVNLLNNNSFSFANFSSNISVSYLLNDEGMSVNGQLRMNDSIIWLSLGKMGFEGIRLLMTPDSVFLINRLESSASSYALDDFLKQQAALSPLASMGKISVFKYVQGLLIGNVLLPDLSYSTTPFDQTATFLNYTLPEAGYLISLLVDNEFIKVKEIHMDDATQTVSVQAFYQNYKKMDKGGWLPENVLFQAKLPQDECLVKIAYSKIQIDDPKMTFPFTWPKK